MMQKIVVLLMFCTALQAKVYTVAMPDDDFYPQYQKDEKIEAIGVLPTILKKFALDHKLQIKFKFLPVKRYMEYLKNNEIDFVFPANPLWSPEFKQGLKLYYSNNVMSSTVGVLVKSEDENITREALKKIGTISGYTLNGFEDDIKAKKVLVTYNNSSEGLLQQVALSRIQGAFFHLDIANYFNRHKKKNLVLAKNLPVIKYDYALLTKQHPDLIDVFNQWMKLNKDWLQAQLKLYDIQMKNGMRLKPYKLQIAKNTY